MPLEVVGTGFGRTGTDSMREALGILGFGPCHHMFEVNSNPEQKRLWRALAAGEPPDWEALFEGYRSCMDWPSAHFWRELVEAYPKAKVILTWRSAESWWASYERTLLPALNGSTDPASLGIALVARQALGGRPDDREHVMAIYEAHVAAVKSTVPPDRLLVHELGDGWGPLCAHLGVAVPDVPYPHQNSRTEFSTRFGTGQDAPAT